MAHGYLGTIMSRRCSWAIDPINLKLEILRRTFHNEYIECRCIATVTATTMAITVRRTIHHAQIAQASQGAISYTILYRLSQNGYGLNYRISCMNASYHVWMDSMVEDRGCAGYVPLCSPRSSGDSKRHAPTASQIKRRARTIWRWVGAKCVGSESNQKFGLNQLTFTAWRKTAGVQGTPLQPA